MTAAPARRVGILISGSGSNMEALIRSMTGDHPGRAALVVCNRPVAAGIGRARALGVAVAVIDHRAHVDRAAFEAEVAAALARADVDLICLAGFMRILTPGFITGWAGRMLNIHPSLLPKYPGLDTHARALAAGDAAFGATVHEVTADLDAGPILGQVRAPVLPGDTPAAMAARLLPLEHQLYTETLRRFAAGDRSRADIWSA